MAAELETYKFIQTALLMLEFFILAEVYYQIRSRRIRKENKYLSRHVIEHIKKLEEKEIKK